MTERYFDRWVRNIFAEDLRSPGRYRLAVLKPRSCKEWLPIQHTDQSLRVLGGGRPGHISEWLGT